MDICRQIASVPFPMATEADLAETERLVEQRGGSIVASRADVRDLDGLRAVVDAGVSELGRLDVVVANAGISSYARLGQMDSATWQDVVDVNLTGVFHTVQAAVPHLVDGGRGGSVVLISSGAALRGSPGIVHYTSAKAALLGMSRSLGVELAPHSIRVNVIAPGNVDTPMIANDSTYRLFRPDLDAPTRADAEGRFRSMQALPVSWLDPVDVSHAVLFLASDEARYITGAVLPVDAGALLR